MKPTKPNRAKRERVNDGSTRIACDYTHNFGEPRLVATGTSVHVLLGSIAADGIEGCIAAYGITEKQAWAVVKYAQECVSKSGRQAECSAFWEGIAAGKKMVGHKRKAKVTR